MIALLVVLSLISLTSSTVKLEFMVNRKVFEIEKQYVVDANHIKAEGILKAMCANKGETKDYELVDMLNPDKPKTIDGDELIFVEKKVSVGDDEVVYQLVAHQWNLVIKPKTSDPSSDVSQSAPSMMIAAFVVIAFLMN